MADPDYVREYMEKLVSLAKDISNKDLRNVVLDLITEPLLSFTSVQPLISFQESPAAPRKHHMFTGGLIVHTYSVARIALALCDILEEVYGIHVDRDLVLAAAILHDIYKFYQYVRDDREGGYKARDDWYLSHDYAIVAELAYRKAGEDIIRVVSEVHGVAPIKTYEGLIVHLADTIDAKFGEHFQNSVIALIQELAKNGSKPYAILNDIVKKHGVRFLSLAVKDRKAFQALIEEKAKA